VLDHRELQHRRWRPGAYSGTPAKLTSDWNHQTSVFSAGGEDHLARRRWCGVAELTMFRTASAWSNR